MKMLVYLVVLIKSKEYDKEIVLKLVVITNELLNKVKIIKNV